MRGKHPLDKEVQTKHGYMTYSLRRSVRQLGAGGAAYKTAAAGERVGFWLSLLQAPAVENVCQSESLAPPLAIYE